MGKLKREEDKKMTTESYTFSLRENIKFETDQPLTVPELIKNLQALEQIVKQSSKAFSTLTNSEIISVELLIEEIEHGSLLEEIILKFTFKNQENLDAFIETSRNWIIENQMTALSVGLGGIVLVSLIAFGLSRLRKNTTPEGRNIIINNYGTIIKNGAGTLNISEDNFRQIIEKSPENKEKLIKNTQKLAQITKNSDNGSIIFGNPNSDVPFEIPPEVIHHIPKDSDPEIREDKTAKFSDITLQIRSLDRDKYTGWLGYIEGAFTQRLPIEIPPNIDLNILSRQEAVKADVTLFYNQIGDKIERKKITLDILHTK